jgi:hypothetical protein
LDTKREAIVNKKQAVDQAIWLSRESGSIIAVVREGTEYDTFPLEDLDTIDNVITSFYAGEEQ